MNSICIEHNPFTVKTIFKINGEEPAEAFGLNSYKEIRLQRWIEKIFFDLKESFNGNGSFYLEFKGVESDYMDIKDAAAQAEQHGMTIELEWVPVTPTEERLISIKKLMNEAKGNPNFAKYIEENHEVRENMDAAFNNDFDVYVVATMSSGKSTLINAMLGQDLLPAANEATTATIAKIIDDKSNESKFSGKRINSDGVEKEKCDSLDLDTLKIWNNQPDTKLIELTGNISAVDQNENVRLVLTDTPGPNNSQDEDHERTTMGYIQDSKRNPLILYVLNATQLGTNDDKKLLNLVAEKMKEGGKQSKDRFIFVVNKMDNFDPESGENVDAALNRVKEYLEENGIDNPNIYPISANLTRLLRKHPDELTRKERNDKNGMEELFLEESSMDLQQYMPLSSRVKNKLAEKNYTNVILRSGLPAVEATVDEYIDKYSFPTRLTRAHKALEKAIELGMQESELMKQLEMDEAELNNLKTEITELKKRSEAGFNSQSYKEQVKRSGKDLPPEVHTDLNEKERKVLANIRNWGDDFTGEVSVTIAEQRVDMVVDEIEFLFKKITNEYEEAFQNSQDTIKDNLHKEYIEHISSLFPDIRKLELPVFKNLKDNISSISLNIEINDNDIESRREVDYYRSVSDSKWYNPFSWGRTREEAVYKTVQFVNLEDLWEERIGHIRGAFSKLKSDATNRITSDKDKLVENYLLFIDKEFTSKFNALLADLESKLDDTKKREAAIKEAKEEQAKIQKLKNKLDNILLL